MNTIESIKLIDVVKTRQEFILSDFIPMPKNTLTLLSSLGGMGKSFLSLQIAGKFIQETNQNVAAWFTEDEAPFVKDRHDKLIENGLLTSINEKKLHLITTAPPQLARIERGVFVANYEELKNLRLWCAEKEIKLLIIDPLLAFYGGDENNNAQARTFMQPFIEFCKNDNINILFIHHASKASADNPSKTRGASAFVDAVRCAYEMVYPTSKIQGKEKPDSEKIERGFRLLKNTKDNRGVRSLLNKNGWIEFSKEIRVLPSIIRANVTVVEYKEKIEMQRI